MSEKQKCSKCGEPKPDTIDHLWACCGDGPGYGDVIKPETLACVKRQLADVTAQLEVADADYAAGNDARVREVEEALQVTREKLEAAEVRVMELERKLEYVQRTGAVLVGLLESDGHLRAELRNACDSFGAATDAWPQPAPEGAKPAETERLCHAEGCDARVRPEAIQPYCFHHAPASPPSPAQAEPVSELARARELFDQAHDGSGVDKDYLWSSVGAILDHLEAVRVLPQQPPTAPGTPLTVEMMVEALDGIQKYYGGPVYAFALALRSELERAQKGGG